MDNAKVEQHICTDFVEAHCPECGAEYNPAQPDADLLAERDALREMTICADQLERAVRLVPENVRPDTTGARVLIDTTYAALGGTDDK